MNKKLFTQICNEWRTNLWLFVELLLVSVVLWFIVDYVYVQTATYTEPRGFNADHCYKIEMGYLTAKSPDFNPADTLVAENIDELVRRLEHRPEIEAVSLSQNSFPYNGSNSGTQVRYDTLSAGTIRRYITPGFLRVFQYTGTRGETPEQLASLLKENTFLASDNIFLNKYHTQLTPFVGKSFYLHSDSTKTYTLAASLKTVRYMDYESASESLCMVGLLPRFLYNVGLELCVRVRPDQDVDFPERLKADSEKQFRIGNVFISEVRSFKDIRRNYQQIWVNNIRNYATGMGFLMLNIFLGLLGTFWFRTQQRRSEVALQLALGSTKRSVFGRLLSEALILLTIATIPAIVGDYNLAHAELNSTYNGTNLEPIRFFVTILATWVLIALMILLGIWFPARKATRIQPAEALHED
ncbi:FtsX-like permease family protein [Bacteroidaceae bacterium HV4-6-C5C]|nr:FtsX-like permease family protein [Bacteroidaceae bacterium HV4-6-C5C]